MHLIYWEALEENHCPWPQGASSLTGNGQAMGIQHQWFTKLANTWFYKTGEADGLKLMLLQEGL